jgi:hypothetical protein
MSLDLGQELACMMREVVHSLKSVEALYHVPYLGRQVAAASELERSAGGQGKSCRHSISALCSHSQSSILDCLLRREPIMRCDAIKSSQQSLFGLSISQTWIQAQ